MSGVDVLSIGALPDFQGVRLSMTIGGAGFYLDMDQAALMAVARRLEMMALNVSWGGLPSNPSEDWRVNDVVNGAVEAFSEPLDPGSGPFGVGDANLRLTVFTAEGEVESYARAAVPPLFRLLHQEEDDVSPSRGPWLKLRDRLAAAGPDGSGGPSGEGHGDASALPADS